MGIGLRIFTHPWSSSSESPTALEGEQSIAGCAGLILPGI